MDMWLMRQHLIGWLIRHGSTDANAGNNFRGWLDFKLDEDGHKSGEQLQRFFGYEQIGRVVCSDLSRSSDTAQYIMDTGQVACPYLSIDPSLRPWNIGDFAGQKKDASTLKRFHKYIDDPNLVIPEGESLNQFRQRNQIVLDLLSVPYDGYPNAIVCHTSNITAAQYNAEIEGSAIEEQSDVVEPGGVVGVYLIDGKLSFEPLMGAGSSEPEGTS